MWIYVIFCRDTASLDHLRGVWGPRLTVGSIAAHPEIMGACTRAAVPVGTAERSA